MYANILGSVVIKIRLAPANCWTLGAASNAAITAETAENTDYGRVRKQKCCKRVRKKKMLLMLQLQLKQLKIQIMEELELLLMLLILLLGKQLDIN
jgi:hypothetical protein